MKTKCLLYCTKGKPYLYQTVKDTNILLKNGECSGFWTNVLNEFGLSEEDEDGWSAGLNGTIVAECEVECEEIHKYEHYEPELDVGVGVFPEFTEIDYCGNEKEWEDHSWLYKQSCLTFEQLDAYLKGENGNALHIHNLNVFDEPLRLSEILKYTQGGYRYNYIKVAPQNMMWVWYKGEKYCLISIRPEWMCKILNGEKTIEVRKKVLKGMI